MPLKQRITREMILERAFDMYCREGMDAINARSVAKALSCSTQPIFSYYSGMGDLKTTLVLRAKELLDGELQSRAQFGAPAVGFGSAYARFAARQPKLYLHLSQTDDPTFPYGSEEAHAALIAREAEHTGLTGEQAADVIEELTCYAMGLATARATGRNACGEDEMDAKILRVHDALVKAM